LFFVNTPDTTVVAGQSVQVNVTLAGSTPTDIVGGLDFIFRIKDSLGQSAGTSPSITSIDFGNSPGSGTLWANVAIVVGAPTLGNSPQFQARNVLLTLDTSLPNGILARVTIATTPQSLGSYTLSLDDFTNPTDDTTFYDPLGDPITGVTFNTAALTVTEIPEPTAVLIGSVPLVLALRRRRRAH